MEGMIILNHSFTLIEYLPSVVLSCTGLQVSSQLLTFPNHCLTMDRKWENYQRQGDYQVLYREWIYTTLCEVLPK